MSKSKTIYSCQSCGAQTPKWMGKCPECNKWNTLVEETYQAPTQVNEAQAKGHASLKSQLIDSPEDHKPLLLKEIKNKDVQRTKTKFIEFDRVLGGGIVPGSMVLVGGDPGIGKSTILMQGLPDLSNSKDSPILYVSGEESAQQIKIRAERLGFQNENLYIFSENNFESILENVKKIKPKILIIDSIQTIFSPNLQSAPGSVSQVRECTAKLMVTAKTCGITTFIVGHVTKDGSIAGPKVLEHMVDTVLYFENTNNSTYRILRAVKNRFGSTNEIGIFEMTHDGLQEVLNPSELFLQERPIQTPGTIVISAIEGSRPILVEVQALVSSTNMPTPRRTTIGVDHNKVSLLVAVLEKRLDVPLYGHDIFVNVAGGIKINEPSADLGVALALMSSFQNIALDSKLFACGEVGLAGEVRRVSHLDQRLSEAEKLGFETAIVPQTSLESLPKSFLKKRKLNLIGVRSLSEAMDNFLEQQLPHSNVARGSDVHPPQ